MEIREALTQITEIRTQVAQTVTFRGYRAAPVAFSGLLAFAAGGAQSIWLDHAINQVSSWLCLWIGVAVLSIVATGAELAWSLRRSPSPFQRQQTFMAITQFLPCLAAGALALAVVIGASPELIWLLPGLWAMFFGLGVFSSRRFLPQPVVYAGGFYLLAGAICLAFARQELALSPWAMSLPFGIGQLLIAAMLYATLERTNEPK